MANGSRNDRREPGRWRVTIAGLLFVGLLLWVPQLACTSRSRDISWTELAALVEADEIAEVTFEGDRVRAKKKGDEPNLVQVVRMDSDDALAFIEMLESHNVPYHLRD